MKRDTEFMNELEAATKIRPATPAILMFMAVVILIVFAFIWAAFSEIEELTRGQGQVVPTQEIQFVQSLEGGILGELLVSEGDLVKKGQVLLRINDTQFSSEERGTEARLLGLTAKKARLEAEASGEKFVLPPEIAEKAPQIAQNETALYESRQRELANAYAILEDRINKANAEIAESGAQINRLSESRKLLNQELKITKDMVAQRAVPKLEEIRLQRELGDISGQINAQSEKRRALQSELAVAQKEKESQETAFRSQALGEMNEVETQLSGLQESLTAIGDRVFRAEVRAPVDGIVDKIALKTIGGVVEPAMHLMEIVPVDDELKIVAKVSPSEIAFIRPGQDTKVKITAYDSRKYGSLDGKLIRIGANSTSDAEGNVFFEIEVRTDKNYMGTEKNPLPITPGMIAETEVVTGKRTILEYLLKPIFRARDRAFTER